MKILDLTHLNWKSTKAKSLNVNSSTSTYQQNPCEILNYRIRRNSKSITPNLKLQLKMKFFEMGCKKTSKKLVRTNMGIELWWFQRNKKSMVTHPPLPKKEEAFPLKPKGYENLTLSYCSYESGSTLSFLASFVGSANLRKFEENKCCVVLCYQLG